MQEHLQNGSERGILIAKDGYFTCPVCRRNKRFLRTTAKTSAKAIPVFCRLCKSEIILDIEGLSARRLSQ